LRNLHTNVTDGASGEDCRRALLLRGVWHADCLIVSMADENYLLLLLQIVCLLMFSRGVVVLTQDREWFGVLPAGAGSGKRGRANLFDLTTPATSQYSPESGRAS
jgi:hypothetical protein